MHLIARHEVVIAKTSRFDSISSIYCTRFMDVRIFFPKRYQFILRNNIRIN